MEKIHDAMEYIMQLQGTPYFWWKEGDKINKHAPFWVSQKAEPSFELVQKHGCNCAGFLNLICRKLKIPIPTWSAGTYGWFRYLKKKNNLVPIQTYKNIADIPVGSVLIRDFESEEEQGHVAIVVESGYIAHCWSKKGICIEPISDSHSWHSDGFYTHVWPSLRI